MGLTESRSFLQGEQVERDDEDTQKRAVILPKQLTEQQKLPLSHYQPPSEDASLPAREEAPLPTSLQEATPPETPPVSVASASEQTEISSAEAPPAAREKEAERPGQLSAPHKNVIPTRRTSFSSESKSAHVVKKSAFSPRNVQPSALSLSEEKESRSVHAERKRDISEEQTGLLPLPPQAARDLSIASQSEQTKESREPQGDQLPAPAHRPSPLIELPTTPLPIVQPVSIQQQRPQLSQKRALLLLVLLLIVVINATVAGFGHFFGPQGWGSVLNGSNRAGGQNLLDQIRKQLQRTPTPGATVQATPVPPTPAQIVDALLSQMTLEQKLGQMMIVQFYGQSYTPQLDAMIRQYHIGGVLFFQFNIGSKEQLKNLNAEMQRSADLPLIISVDQEGGTVDRFVNLDGPQPSAASIGQSGNTNNAYQQGRQDAQNLSRYGFNLNLAPVVDVHTVDNPQLYLRTYGDNAALVTQMAGAYLKGLQESGQVLGTLKHFPGLGDVSDDPHFRPPDLTRSLQELNSIDWAPYRDLINQGHVHAIMVTHEYVQALDTSEPSSLSPSVIGILRNQLHYQGVIITDGLTMASITNYYTPGQAAAKAIEAGDDILMGAESPSSVAAMINGIKQALNSGAITKQRINESVRRILLLKYQMGILHLNP